MSEKKQTDLVPLENDDNEVISRGNLGHFIKGVSGNPKGRPKGSKSRTIIMKQAMEEALTRDAAKNFSEIVNQAIEMAKAGDKDMIKFVLGDVLKEARRADPDEEESRKIGKIEITFAPFTGNTSRAEKVIEAEFAEISVDTHKKSPLARRE